MRTFKKKGSRQLFRLLSYKHMRYCRKQRRNAEAWVRASVDDISANDIMSMSQETDELLDQEARRINQ